MKIVSTTPAALLRSVPDERRADMTRLHREIVRVMKGLPCVVWEGVFWGGSAQRIIGYGEHRYTRADGKDVHWFIVGLALQKQYISVYVNAVDGRRYLAETYGKKLGRVKVGKSSVSFASLADVKLDVLLEMIGRARALQPR